MTTLKTLPGLKIAVIIKVPPQDNKENLALAMAVYLDDDGLFNTPAKHIVNMQLRTPVFYLGEILFLGADGREVNGRGRKPDKWGVTCEYFTTIEQAIAKAQEIPF